MRFGARGEVWSTRSLPVFVAIFCALSLQAGTITGTVRAEGKAGADADALCGKYDSREFKFIERINYAEMRDFLVFIEGPVGDKVTPPDKPVQVRTERITQKGATFVPHVLPVVVGTTVEWPNHDEIFHNVFSFSEPCPFDLGLYKGTDAKPVTFAKPGRVDVFCSIHSRMGCIVMVLENAFFAMTDNKGHYTIQNVPAGKYKLKAWHERLPTQSEEVTVEESGEIRIDFVLGIKGLPKK